MKELDTKLLDNLNDSKKLSRKKREMLYELLQTEAKKGNMKILQDTGELRRSVTYEADSSSVKVGSKLKYARIHQFGGTVNVNRVGQYKRDHKNHRFKRRGNSYSYSHKVTIPARPFLGVNDAEKQHITSMFKQYLKRNILGG